MTGCTAWHLQVPLLSCDGVCRYSKQAKDWGWREFLTLTTLFDVDAGFLVNDAVQFTAEVLVLKESYTILEVITCLAEASWGYCCA